MQTKKLLSESFYKLLLEKPFHQITVDMILEESGLSRSTFYRHFKDKCELMNYYYQSYLENLRYDPKQDNWRDLTYTVLCFMKEHRVFFAQIQKVTGQNSFFDFLLDYCVQMTTNMYCFKANRTDLSFKETQAILYTCAGSVAIVKKWFENNLDQSVEVVAEVIYQCVPPIINEKFKIE